jgi:hypothetical protein
MAGVEAAFNLNRMGQGNLLTALSVVSMLSLAFFTSIDCAQAKEKQNGSNLVVGSGGGQGIDAGGCCKDGVDFIPGCVPKSQGDSTTNARENQNAPGGNYRGNPGQLMENQAGFQGAAGREITPEMRIKRQYMRIKRGEMTGQLSSEQAKTLRQAVADAESQLQELQTKGEGNLKPEDLKAVESRLHENANQIQTMLGGGTHKVESEKVLGPNWTPGPDGAQDPKSLLKQMKSEEKRELRQERQRNMQAIEQQQLEYEKSMLNKLGNQRPEIQKDKRQLENIRQKSGADGTVKENGED